MIRYRDGKIVSTKGERFSQVKNNCNHSPVPFNMIQVTKEESEEMKKTIVSITCFSA